MAASDKELGDLHKKVAKVLTDALESDELSVAAVNAAIAFLKNNNITASPTDNAELAELNKQLAERRKKGKSDLMSKLNDADVIAGNYTALGAPPVQ